MEKNSRRSLKNSIKELEVGLLKLSNPTYDNIDKLMINIMKKYDLTAKELHYGFRDSHQNKAPDEWIKEKRKMKTFKEFYNYSLIIHKNLYEAAKTFSSSKLGYEYYNNPKNHPGYDFVMRNRARAGQPPAYRLAKKESKQKAEEKRKQRIRDLTHSSELPKGQKKAKKLQGAGLEAHHITPLDYSAKLKASMSPKEWEARVKADAERGVYHGHHHKNIMGVVHRNTPESRKRRGILHRAGGAHEVEQKTRDLYSTAISHKDLLSAAHRRKVREDKKKEKESK